MKQTYTMHSAIAFLMKQGIGVNEDTKTIVRHNDWSNRVCGAVDYLKKQGFYLVNEPIKAPKKAITILDKVAIASAIGAAAAAKFFGKKQEATV